MGKGWFAHFILVVNLNMVIVIMAIISMLPAMYVSCLIFFVMFLLICNTNKSIVHRLCNGYRSAQSDGVTYDILLEETMREYPGSVMVSEKWIRSKLNHNRHPLSPFFQANNGLFRTIPVCVFISFF